MNILDVIRSGDYLVLDCESTGLDRNAEICQLAIINSKGETLLDTFVKPVNPIPESATAIHGITNEMVKDAKTFDHHKVWDLLVHNNVVIYNADYDTRMLYQSEDALKQENYDWVNGVIFHCAMLRFAAIYGDWNIKFKSYKWKSLDVACNFYGIQNTGAHSALSDCKATLEVCRKMVASEGIE